MKSCDTNHPDFSFTVLNFTTKNLAPQRTMIEIIGFGYLKITYSNSRFLRLVNTLLGRVWMAGEYLKNLPKVIVEQGIRYFII